MKVHRFCRLLCCFAILQIPLLADNIRLSGLVYDQTTGQPLPGVNIIAGSGGTVTDAAGRFELTVAAQQELVFSHIGYREVKMIPSGEYLKVSLLPMILPGEPVFVSATRAVAGITPVAFSTLTADEIEARYTVEDVPHDPGAGARCVRLQRER
ncbi:MAG: carboxypeptidase-like regulatory domain-containing protein [Candidatus Neomarinimicrobiota bacterium]